MFPQLARFTDLGLLLLRFMVGLVFVTSGYSHQKDPQSRAFSHHLFAPELHDADGEDGLPSYARLESAVT